MQNSVSGLTQNDKARVPSRTPSLRILKIELLGDGWRQKTFSGIRLKGRWLTDAGFLPGQRVSLTLTSPGVMELRLLSDSAALPEPQIMRQADLDLQDA